LLLHQTMNSASVFTEAGTIGPTTYAMGVVQMVVTGVKSCCGL